MTTSQAQGVLAEALSAKESGSLGGPGGNGKKRRRKGKKAVPAWLAVVTETDISWLSFGIYKVRWYFGGGTLGTYG